MTKLFWKKISKKFFSKKGATFDTSYFASNDGRFWEKKSKKFSSKTKSSVACKFCKLSVHALNAALEIFKIYTHARNAALEIFKKFSSKKSLSVDALFCQMTGDFRKKISQKFYSWDHPSYDRCIFLRYTCQISVHWIVIHLYDTAQSDAQS